LLSLPAGLRNTAVLHMSINLIVVALFAMNAWMRVRTGDAGASSNTTMWLSLVAIALLLVSGWLGGKLVYEGGVAVDTENLKSSRPESIKGSRTERHEGSRTGSLEGSGRS
jgi:uncharacterized membrane protein